MFFFSAVYRVPCSSTSVLPSCLAEAHGRRGANHLQGVDGVRELMVYNRKYQRNRVARGIAKAVFVKGSPKSLLKSSGNGKGRAEIVARRRS